MKKSIIIRLISHLPFIMEMTTAVQHNATSCNFSESSMATGSQVDTNSLNTSLLPHTNYENTMTSSDERSLNFQVDTTLKTVRETHQSTVSVTETTKGTTTTNLLTTEETQSQVITLTVTKTVTVIIPLVETEKSPPSKGQEHCTPPSATSTNNKKIPEPVCQVVFTALGTLVSKINDFCFQKAVPCAAAVTSAAASLAIGIFFCDYKSGEA